ncbi:MAG: hypothetical protein J7J15_01985 [Candidatus Aenigmarchaeota archaeon]|nr:hypothetical protein [Candidatus Aenigmarchaeota archaeon]
MFEEDINGNPSSERVDPVELLKTHDIYCGVYGVPLDGICEDISRYTQGMLEKMRIEDISLGYVEKKVKFAAEYLKKLKGKGIEDSLNDVEEEVTFAAEYLKKLKEKLKGKGIEDISFTDVEKKYEELSKDYESYLNNINLFFSGGEKRYEDSLKIKREIYNSNRSFTEEIKELNEHWSILKELLLTTLMLEKSLNDAKTLIEKELGIFR